MATDYKPADLNKDGEVTPKERKKYRETKDAAQQAAGAKPGEYEPAKDTITRAELESRYGFAKRVVWDNPELRRLYQQAIKQEWTDAEFDAQLKSSKWYQENAEYARKAWTAERLGGADWDAQVEEARLAVQEAATQMGAPLDTASLEREALRYIREGWSDPNRKGLMEKALADRIEGGEGFMRGEAGNLQETLMSMARKNGLLYSDSYYESAARSVASGLMTEDDFIRDMREQAASLWAPWSDKIMAGLDAEDLASGYRNMMGQTLEIDPDQIGLDNPYLRRAIMNTDDKGNPAPMNLYDFQMMLRDDPAWMKTKQATDSISSIGYEILQRMGFQA